MKRVVIHWTAGGHKANAIDKRHYHLLIEGDGAVVPGDKLPEANADCTDGDYAAHTRALNTGSIGVAVCAMHGAQERPFRAGAYPITDVQMDALIETVADLCATYSIPVDRRTVLTHAEVEPTLGVAQRGKWDITWLPDMPAPDDPVRVGDRIRQWVRQSMAAVAASPRPRPRVRDVATDGEAGGAAGGLVGVVMAIFAALSDLPQAVQFWALGLAGLLILFTLSKRLRRLL